MKNKVFLTVIISFLGTTFAEVGPNWIEQWGIRWTFDKPISKDGAAGTYHYGTFVNSDYWVKGPVNIISITPESILIHETDGDWINNGSQLNPVSSTKQGYDNKAQRSGDYDANLNVAIGVSPASPLSIQTGSLVSAISRDTSKNLNQLKTSAVLTVLASVPPAGSFRPGFYGSDKTVKFNINTIDTSFLQNLSLVTGAPANLTTQKLWFTRPWIQNMIGWSSSSYFPVDNMPVYGREISRQTSEAALYLNMNYPPADKQVLLINYIQLGIDIYSLVKDAPAHFAPDGGNHHGRKLPLLVAAKATGDDDMEALLAKTGDYFNSNKDEDGYPPSWESYTPVDYYQFQEDGQIFYVTKFDVEITNDEAVGYPAWDPDSRVTDATPYETSDIGLAEWGIRHSTRPETSIYGPNWTRAIYRNVAGCTHPAIALAVQIMGLKTLWNHPALFDYADRYMRMIENVDEVWGTGDSTWTPITDWQLNTNGVGKFVRNMWAAYRADYGPSWKPSIECSDWPRIATITVTYNLTINTKDCSVLRTPNKTSYTSGEKVVLTVKPFDDCHFIHWTTTVNEVTTILSTDNPFIINMDSNKTVTAICKPNPTKGQVFHAPLDDGSGTTATDANNIQLTANLVNGPLWGAGWRDEDWLGFNQSTQAITIPTMGMSPQAGTIAVWVEPTDFSGMKFILGHVLNNANRLSLYTVAGSLAAGLGSNATLKTNITPLPLNQPVHLALSWNGTAYTVYVNGVQKAAGTFSGLTALNTFIDIGNYGDPAFRSLGFAGKIDDIRTYNRALAAEEIDALYLTHDVRQGKDLQFTVNAVNAQGIPIVYQAAAMPAGASFDAATQSVTWTPWHNQLGLFSFRFTATGQAEKLVTVEVHPVENSPWRISALNVLRQQGQEVR